MADIKQIQVGGSTFDINDATARSGLGSKTNASVLPNDGGDIKTKFRIANQGYTNGATWYYPLVTLPADNAGNSASCIISGRIGGWQANNMGSVSALCWNRDETGIALLNIAGSASSMSSIWNTCDIAIYTNSDTTDTIYLRTYGYFTYDIDIELYQSSANIVYDGTYITTPSGTLNARASTSSKRAEIVKGKLYVSGTEMQPLISDLSTIRSNASSGASKVSCTDATVGGFGYTKNSGTVTSVRVQAGTGLSSSQSTAQTGTLNTTLSVASGYKLPTTTEWSGKQDTLVSGTNIKTVNGENLLGSGNISITGVWTIAVANGEITFTSM